ncbi:hypothetical protein WJX77_009304 [Trebouxia sp. C0004]
MDGGMDAFDAVNSELRMRKIEKREQRGYAAGPIAWQSHKKQKFHCSKCKRSFPRMEILLQHFRDCSRHSGEAISAEASVQMSAWLLAKDQRQHCCRTCCLGFQTEPELLVHLKHTAVHQGSSEAQQAASLLLPKDEARLMRRDLQGSAAGSDSILASEISWSEHVQSLNRCDKAQTQADDSRTQAGEQVQLPKAEAQTDPAVKIGEQLLEDNTQTDAVCDRTEDGKSVGPKSGSTSPKASLRPLQRRVVAKKRKRHSSISASVQEDNNESALACTDDVEMAMIEPRTSNQTHIDNPGKKGRKEKKLACHESRPITIYREPNKITFAF